MSQQAIGLLKQSINPPAYNPQTPSQYGPLGVGMETKSGQTATEITTTMDNPKQPGTYINIPLLTPNQTGLENLLNGAPATHEQYKRALDWAMLSGYDFPAFKDIPSAVAAAKERSNVKGQDF
jgi:hypothetical protein